MRKLTKVFTMIITLAMVLAAVPFTAMADGSYYVDNSYMVLRQGQSGTITIIADNAAGRVDWYSSGSVSASGSAYLDNGVATIEVYANSVGTGYITVEPTDIATYDEEVIGYSYTIQVDVVGEDGGYTDGNNTDTDAPAADFGADDNGYTDDNGADDYNYEEPTQQQEQETTTRAEEETTTPASEERAAGSNEVLTDGNNDYEDLSNEERLYTSVGNQELYIIQYPRWIDDNGNEVWNDEVFNLDMLNGFTLKTVNYKGVDVDSFEYKDLLRVFVLKNLETDSSGYYTLSNEGKGFSPLSYVTANGKQYIVIDFPEDFVIPEGYQMVEMSLGTNTVHALKKIVDGVSAAPAAAPAADNDADAQDSDDADVQDDSADEEMKSGAYRNVRGADAFAGSLAGIVIDSRTKVMLKGYETLVSPGLESTDPTGDIYYIYCLVDGETQLYSYDSGEGTLQRASIVVYNEIPTEPETVIVYETNPAAEVESNDGSLLKGIGWNNMQIQMKVLLIALAVAIILIIILIILFAAMSHKNKKRAKKSNARKYPQDTVPTRSSGRPSRSGNDEEESFFSYVKTEKDDFDLEELR